MGFDGCVVPGALRPYVDWVTGMAWPEGDEHGCFRMADACVVAAHEIVADTNAAEPKTAAMIGDKWNGEAQQLFSLHVARTIGGKRAVLVKQLIDAAIKLNGVGLAIQHTKRMITFIVLFLLVTIPLLMWQAPWLLRPLLQVTRLSALQIAKRTLILMAMFAGFGVAMDYAAQVSQINGGRRDQLDLKQLLTTGRDGAINGLLVGLLGGGLGRLATPALRAGVARAEAAFGEKLLSLVMNTVPGQALQYGLAGSATTAISMAIDGRPMDWDLIVKGGTAGMLGTDGQHLARLAETGPHPHTPEAPRAPLDPGTIPHDQVPSVNRIDSLINRGPDPSPPVRVHTDAGSLARSAATGIVDRQTIRGRTELVTFGDGTQAVRKEAVHAEARDAEYYSAKIRQAAGADVPPVVKDGARGLFIGWADGKPLRTPWDGGSWHAGGLERTAAGVRQGLGYALTLDHDGKPEHIRVGDRGQVRSFDGDLAFRGMLPDSNNPFVRRFFDENGFVDNPLTRADIDQVRQRLAEHEAEMRADHRDGWYDSARAALDLMEPHAKGDVSIFDLPPDRSDTLAGNVEHWDGSGWQHEPPPRGADLDPDTREPLPIQHTPQERAALRGTLANTIDPAQAARPSQWAEHRRSIPALENFDARGDGMAHVEKRQLSVGGKPVTEYTVTVRYRPDEGMGPQPLARMMSDAMDGVDLYYNFQHRLPDGSQLHVRLAFEEARPTAGRHEYVLMSPGQARPSSGQWFLGNTPMHHAHELGHLLGHDDTYPDRHVPGRRTMTAPDVRADRSLMGGPYVETWLDGRPVMDRDGNTVPALLSMRDHDLRAMGELLPDHHEFSPEPRAEPRLPDRPRGRFDGVGDLVGPRADFAPGQLQHVKLLDRAEALYGGQTPDEVHHARALSESAQHFYGQGADNLIRVNDLARLRDLGDLLGGSLGRALPDPDFLTSRVGEVLGVRDIEPRALEGLARMAEWITESGRGPAGPEALHRLAAEVMGEPPGPATTLRAAHQFSDAAERSIALAEGRGSFDFRTADAWLRDRGAAAVRERGRLLSPETLVDLSFGSDP